MKLDTNEFRRVMGHFATGVTIVTTKNEGEYHGLTVNSFTSVSLDPMLVLVNISKHADSHDLIRNSRIFAVNFLTAEQEWLSNIFASNDVLDRFAGLDVREAVSGAPLLDGIMAYLDVRVREIIDGGDHSVFIGEVTGQQVLLPDAPPLLYYRGNYAHIVPCPPKDDIRQVPRE